MPILAIYNVLFCTQDVNVTRSNKCVQDSSFTSLQTSNSFITLDIRVPCKSNFLTSAYCRVPTPGSITSTHSAGHAIQYVPTATVIVS